MPLLHLIMALLVSPEDWGLWLRLLLQQFLHAMLLMSTPGAANLQARNFQRRLARGGGDRWLLVGTDQG